MQPPLLVKTFKIGPVRVAIATFVNTTAVINLR